MWGGQHWFRSIGATTTIVVAFGTLRNGGGLDFFTSDSVSTTVNSGAKLDVNDQNAAVAEPIQEGVGSVTLGTKASTISYAARRVL